MRETKEQVLIVSLRLFACRGYEAVSTGDIAGVLGITKAALYRHYKNKQDIFDCIVARMVALDAKQAAAFCLPVKRADEDAKAYTHVVMEQIVEYSKAQFAYWTREDFPCLFRRMLTIEQYRNETMSRLYQQYLTAGPVDYLTDLFVGLGLENPQEKATAFYAPMLLSYALFDADESDESVAERLTAHFDKWRTKEV